MQFLTFVNYIDDFVRLEQFFTLYQCRKVCGIIKCCTVGLQDHTRWDLFGIGLFFDIYHECSIINMRIAFLLQSFHHIRDVFLCVRFPFPEVKFNIQVRIVFLQVCHRHIHNVIPDCTVTALSALQLEGRIQCFFSVIIMLFCISGRCRIDFLQVTDGKWCFFWIFSGEIIIKIRKIRLAFLQFCDNQSHLISPVSKVDITNHFIAHKTGDSLYAFSDDCGAEMSDVKRFCHVRSAVINNNFFRILYFFHAELFVCFHLVQIICDCCRVGLQVDETWLNCFCSADISVLRNLCHNFFCDHDRCFVVLFCTCHRTIALIFT